MNNLTSIKLIVTVGWIMGLLVGCHTTTPSSKVDSYSDVAKTSRNAGYVRPLEDGAPWWDVDVSNIPDAIPIVHSGNYKKDPYSVLGKTYYPRPTARGYQEVGTASWYGTKFHGQATANGEIYDLYGMTAAHKTLPLPSYVKVTNLDNGRSVILRVNDRGPFYSNRVIDLSFAAAKKLGYADMGTARVKVEGIEPSQWWANQGMIAPNSDKEAKAAMAKKQQQVAAKSIPVATIKKDVLLEYKPPKDQHAIPASKTNGQPIEGIYLQVAAFSNPDAAELLKQRLIEITANPVFISSVVQGQQTFYRVRLGPLADQQQMLQAQQAIRIAKLGQATLVKKD